MQQVNLHGPGDVRLDEVPRPSPGPRDVVVRVAACGICGSDLGYIELGGVAGPTGRPTPLGHELAGVVDAAGSEVEGLPPGTRVVVNPLGAGNIIGNGGREGGFAPYLLVRNAADGGCVFPIPDGVPFDRAALAEPLGVALHAVERVGVRPADKVAVFGAGPIGLAATFALRQLGVTDVVAVDLSPRRLELARRLGARAGLEAGRQDVWRALRELHGTAAWLGAPMVGTDVYVDAAGHAPLVGEIVASAKQGARLSVVALHRGEVPVNFMLLMAKQLTIAGSMAYPADYGAMLRMLARADLTPMVTHRFPLERFHDALAVARDPAAGGKVLIEMGQGA